MPTALDARLDHVGGQLLGSTAQLAHLGSRRHASPVRWEPVPEHVRHQLEVGLVTDRAPRRRLGTDVARRPDQLGMRVTHLLTPEPTDAHLVDDHPASETMIDDAAPFTSSPQGTGREAHRHEAS